MVANADEGRYFQIVNRVYVAARNKNLREHGGNRSCNRSREFEPIQAVQIFERVCESQDVQKWEVGFRELARIDATEPDTDKEWKSSEGVAHLYGSFAPGHGNVVSLLPLVVVGVDENLGQVFKVRNVATFNEEEDNVFNAFAWTSVLPIDQDWLTTVDMVIPKQVREL